MRPPRKHGRAWTVAVALLTATSVVLPASADPVNLDDPHGVAECFGNEVGMEGLKEVTPPFGGRIIYAHHNQEQDGFTFHQKTNVWIGSISRNLAYFGSEQKVFADKNVKPGNQKFYMRLSDTPDGLKIVRLEIDGELIDVSDKNLDQALARLEQEPERVEKAFKTMAAAVKCFDKLEAPQSTPPAKTAPKIIFKKARYGFD